MAIGVAALAFAYGGWTVTISIPLWMPGLLALSIAALSGFNPATLAQRPLPLLRRPARAGDRERVPGVRGGCESVAVLKPYPKGVHCVARSAWGWVLCRARCTEAGPVRGDRR